MRLRHLGFVARTLSRALLGLAIGFAVVVVAVVVVVVVVTVLGSIVMMALRFDGVLIAGLRRGES